MRRPGWPGRCRPRRLAVPAGRIGQWALRHRGARPWPTPHHGGSGPDGCIRAPARLAARRRGEPWHTPGGRGTVRETGDTARPPGSPGSVGPSLPKPAPPTGRGCAAREARVVARSPRWLRPTPESPGQWPDAGRPAGAPPHLEDRSVVERPWRRGVQSQTSSAYGRRRAGAAAVFQTITFRRKKQTSSPCWLNALVSTVTTPRSSRDLDSTLSMTFVSA